MSGPATMFAPIANESAPAPDPKPAPPAPSPAIALLKYVSVKYCTDAAKATALLVAMVAAGTIALDIETAGNPSEVARCKELTAERDALAGKIKALRRLKAPAAEIDACKAERKRLKVRIKIAGQAGLDPKRARIRLVQAYAGGREVLVIDLDRTGVGVLAALNGADVVAHNAGFEMSFIEHAGIGLGEVHCTMQAARLTLGEKQTSLADAALAYLNVALDKKQQVSNWGAEHLSREQVDYAALDAVVEWLLDGRVMQALRKQTSAYEIQMAAVPAVMRMEGRGFKLDVAAHARLMEELRVEREREEFAYCEACLAAGHANLAQMTPTTPARKGALLEALLSEDELRKWKRTPTGALSTARSEMLKAAAHPPALALVRLAKIDKAVSAFGDSLTAFVSPITGRIHAHYMVAATAAGRASCSKPNLQRIPADPRFRALFVAEPGNVLVVADYATMEMRAAAHIFGDKAMTRAFENGEDLHDITAARMLRKDPKDVSKEERKGGKAVNFGAIYGQGAAGLVRAAWERWSLILSLEEAQKWTQAFKDSYPGLVRGQREHHQKCQEQSRIVIGRDAARGFGRIFPFSRLKKADDTGYTRSRNLPIQGACADAAMLALAYTDTRLFDAEIDGGLVAWIHDEFIVEVAVEDAERAADILRQAMIDGFSETFPGAPLNGLVDLHIGASWSEAKSGAIRTASDVAPERVKLRDVDEGAIEAAATADLDRNPLEGLSGPSGAMTFYEFFAGAGMAREGLGPDWLCVFANDNDAGKARSYANNFGRKGLVVRDVAHLRLSDLPGAAMLAWASFPCPDLSAAGQRKGLDGWRSNAVWPFLKLMQGLRAEERAPRLIVLENVAGLLEPGQTEFFTMLCDGLTNAGYLYGVVMIDAVMFVPQSRQRVFIIGIDADTYIPAALFASEPRAPFHPPALVAACKRQRDPIWWRLPIPPKRNSAFADLIEDHPTGVLWHSAGETERLIAMMAPVHLAKLEAASRAGRKMVGGLYRRMRDEPSGRVQRVEVRFDDVAGCLRMPTGGSSRQTIVVVEGASIRSRLLSPREAARLMGLPDTYKLPGNYNDAYGLMGDGVVAPVVRFLAEHILEPIVKALPEPEAELSGEEVLRRAGL